MFGFPSFNEVWHKLTHVNEEASSQSSTSAIQSPQIPVSTDSPSLQSRVSQGDPSMSKAAVMKRAEYFHAQLKDLVFPNVGGKNSTALDQVRTLYDETVIRNTLMNTRTLVHPEVSVLIDGFLQYKLKFGSNVEKQLYEKMTKEAFLARLITKRPLVFMGSSDYFKLRDGTKGQGGFEEIGTKNEKNILLKDYLSYDEMEIAAMIGVSAPTRFINKGDSYNRGFVDSTGNYEKEGICMGLVGVRLEREDYMEFQRVMVTPSQNTKEKGYGPLPTKEEDDTATTAKMRLYAKFYQVAYFPTFDEIRKAQTTDFSKCGKGFISKKLYKKRIKINIENYLFDANARAQEQGKKAYAQPYGWGLSAWILTDIQREWFLEAFLEVLEEKPFSHIADVDFSFIMKYQEESPGLQKFRSQDGQKLHGICLHFPQSRGECRELCAKLTGMHEGKLLVNSYGWDGNSYSGNEYWDGALSASGDPIMMCASPLQVFAQTPEINPYLTKNICFTGKVGLVG